VAALSSREADDSAAANRFRLLRELGARPVPTWAALETLPNGRAQLVVVERVARGGDHGDQDIADWVRDARRIAALEHPNVARVRDVLIRSDDVLVATEFIDGVRWSELSGQGTPLELTLRIFLDVLAGLSALHNLRDAKRQPLKLVHGELTPECVLVGLDGVSRIVGSCRAKIADAPPGRASSGYLAPEVLLSDDSADARADIFSVGVMLWEALSGKPLFDVKTQPSAIVTKVLGGHVPPPTVPIQCAWAAPLVAPIARALSADPERRFASAPAMAAELRRIAGPRLAPPSRLAAHVRANFGEKIGARRDHLERSVSRAPEVSREVSREVPRVEPQLTPSADGIPVTVGSPSEAPTPVPPRPPPVAPAPRQAPPTEAKPPPLPAPPAAPPPPPQPSGLRPRLPTLNGMSPPVSRAADVGPPLPLVVPTSRPPLVPAGSVSLFDENPSSVHVPAAPRVPSDLAEAARALSTVDPLPARGSPMPRTLPMASSPPATSAPSPMRRGVLLGVFLVPAVLGGLLVVWIESRPATRTQSPTKPLASAISPSSATAPPVAPGATPSVTAMAAPAASSAPAGDGQLDPRPSAPPAPLLGAPSKVPTPAPFAPRVVPPPIATASPSPLTPAPTSRAIAPPPPSRRARPKYEPEGI
jgi:serine/threonine-protein kinase